MAWHHCIRPKEWTKKEMENTVCTCPETGNPDEFGEGSSLPCMEIGSDLRCSQCMWCKLTWAQAYCDKFNGNEDEYSRDITKIDVTL